MKRPRRASLDEVKISRNGDYADIEFADPTAGNMNLKIGPEVAWMNDQEILDVYNSIVFAMEESARNWDNTVVEIPPGQPQIKYFDKGEQWTPRGSVLRVFISEDDNGLPEFYIDDQVLTLEEFGRMLTTHAGWGMRIAFVPEDRLEENPKLEVRQPSN
jgi:hypothetical protein